MHRKVVERWLYGALTGTAQLFSNASTIFPPLLVCACKALGGEQECPLRVTGRWPAGLKGVTCSRTRARGASFCPPTARKRCPTATLRWLLTTRDHFLADI
jgi:hypothetical protein